MKIISWNVNSIRARLDNFFAVCKKYNPDVFLLQETKVGDDDFPIEFIEDLGYNIAIKGENSNKKGRNGVAIFSKHILEDVKTDFCEEARYIEAFTGGAFIASVYVPNGQQVGSDQYYYKLEFLRLLKSKFMEFKEEVFIAGGDFNVAPYANDTYIENYEDILCSPQERERISEIREAGFQDALQHKGYTWWDYRNRFSLKKDRGFRIDHFYLSEKAMPLFSGGEVLRDTREMIKPSDHAAIECVINI